MAKIVLFLFVFFSVRAEIIEISSMEEIFPYIDQGTLVLGLSAQPAPIDPDTLKQLAYIGIEYSFNTPFRPQVESKVPESWEGGIMYLSDFEGKAEVFRKWLEVTLIKPSQIVLIDDKMDHFAEMQSQIDSLGISSVCFQLGK